MKIDAVIRAEIVKNMLANPMELYSRVSNGFAMAYGETTELRRLLHEKAAMLRAEADAIDAAVLQIPSEAASWYEIISAERDEAKEAMRKMVK